MVIKALESTLEQKKSSMGNYPFTGFLEMLSILRESLNKLCL